MGCYDLGTLSEHGTGGLEKDLGKALELYRKACGLGYEYGCEEAERLGGK
jgi:TPR repeat protein